MIEQGKQLPNGDHPQLRWICGKVEEVRLSPPYALITAGSSIHWMQWERAFPRWSRDSFGRTPTRGVPTSRRKHMNTFAGKAVLVTGAGAGIGYALCQAFASAGATVALNDIDPTLCQTAAQQINAPLGVERVYPYACDVADVEAVRLMFQRFVGAAGRLDIVVANAGITNYGGFLTYTPEAFDRLMGVNLRGSFFTAQNAARIMIDAHIPGRIILKSSVTGIQAHMNLGGVRDHQSGHSDDGENHCAGSGQIRHYCQRHQPRRDPHRTHPAR